MHEYLPPRSGYGIDFDAPQPDDATSDPLVLRDLEPVELTLDDLTVSFRGGTTCVEEASFDDASCSTDFTPWRGLWTASDGHAISVMGPGTTEQTIVVRDATGDEVGVEMLTPHFWSVPLADLTPPLMARIGDFQCFGIGVDLDLTTACVPREAW